MLFPNLHPNSWHPQPLSRPSSLGQQHSSCVPQNVTTQCSSLPTFKNERPGDCKYHTLCLAHPMAIFSMLQLPSWTSKHEWLFVCPSSSNGKGCTHPSWIGLQWNMAAWGKLPLTVLCLLVLTSLNFRYQSDFLPGPFLWDQYRCKRREVCLLPCFSVAWICLCWLPRCYARQEGRQLSQTSL